MNKYLWFMTLLVYLMIMFNNFSTGVIVDAASYDSFSEIILDSGKLLSDYTEHDYDKYNPLVEDRKFMGWNTHIVNKEVKVEFIEKTILEVKNENSSPVEYKYQVTRSNDSRTILDASGSIGFDIKGDIKKFKNNLNAKINIGYKEENINTVKKTEELKISCDPKTKLLITIKGTGIVTNGVAAYYFLWLRLQMGGFEYFTITHEFQSIEKVSYEKS